jgi:hypothetical protein
MKLRRAFVALALVPLSLLFAGTAFSLAAKSREDGPKLLSQLERENDPVRKAKLEVRLGRLRLEEAFAAYSNGKYDDCWKLLGEYEDFMDRAWADLQASGRIAARKPDGFKQLDIGLRESRRDLIDFETRITFDERQAIQKIRMKTEDLHNLVLKALFPSTPPAKDKSNSLGPPPSDSPQKGDRE